MLSPVVSRFVFVLHTAVLLLFKVPSIETRNQPKVVSYEELLQVFSSHHQEALTLDKLSSIHNLTAILHFIELTHNFTNEELEQCRRVSLLALNYSIETKPYEQLEPQAEIATRTAHILTNILNSHFENNVSLHHVIEKKELYWSLLVANLESHPQLYGNGISLSTTIVSSYLPSLKHFSPYLHRANLDHDLNNTIRVNLASLNKQRDQSAATGMFNAEWAWRDWFADYDDIVNEWQSAKAHNHAQLAKGVWSSPYLDCGLTKKWLITYLVPFFKIDSSRVMVAGVVYVNINLDAININQCPNQHSFFADTHKCHTPSTECHYLQGNGFRRGSYYCKCRPGYYYPDSNTSQPHHTTSIVENGQIRTSFDGKEIEQAFIEELESPSSTSFPGNFICLPCEPGCRDCDDSSPCIVKVNHVLRTFILALQVLCILACFVTSIVVLRTRTTKRIASSRWVLLETILFGSILLYSTIIIRYHESSTTTCFLEPWFREIGFAFSYGSIVIKVYRIYAEFQTRKAHRVCVRDKDLLKYLFGIVLIVFGYMSAWTALVIDGIDNIKSFNLFGSSFNFTSKNILDIKYAQNGLKFYVCRQLAWDYVTEIGELLFLLSGVYLTYCIRNAKKEIYKEKVTLTLSITLEAVVSLATYAAKHLLWMHPSLHPDHLLVLFTLRCHATVTPTIIILFAPKIFYKKPKRALHHRSRHLSSAEVSDTFPEAINLYSAILSNGEIDIGEINLSDMDPEDIRSELRRVYTQLQVLKNKSVRKDNPHISKRRGGRKSHRRFSLQQFHHKHKAQHDQEVTEISRTPEESTASFDGNTSCVPDGPSMAKVEVDYPTTTVSSACRAHPHKHP